MKDVTGLTITSVGLGAGTLAVGAMGGSTAGLSAVSGMMPVASTTIMAGHIIRKTKKWRI